MRGQSHPKHSNEAFITCGASFLSKSLPLTLRRRHCVQAMLSQVSGLNLYQNFDVSMWYVNHVFVRLVLIDLRINYNTSEFSVSELKNEKFWEKLMAYFLLIRRGPHSKRHIQKFFLAAGTCLPSRCIATVKDAQTDSQTLL
jgi:hypothetical protein